MSATVLDSGVGAEINRDPIPMEGSGEWLTINKSVNHMFVFVCMCCMHIHPHTCTSSDNII